MASQFDLDRIDTREIGRLMELLADSDIEECEIERGEFRLSLRRAAREATTRDAPAASAAAAPEDTRQEALIVRAPAVGVFTRAEKASASPRAEIGGRVSTGDVVGYIEIMMIPHSVLATGDGIVDSFLVEDGEPVEYGQPLVALKPIFDH